MSQRNKNHPQIMKLRPKQTKRASKKVDIMCMPRGTGNCQSHESSISGNEDLYETNDSTPTSTEQETSSAISQIGHEHVKQGNFGKALDFHRRALALHKKESGGLQNEHTAKHYDNLGSVYHGTGAANRAASYFHKALAIRLNVHGEDHLKTAQSYDKVGIAYAEQGDYERALNFHHKAKHVKKKLFGREHGNTARSFWTIGDVHYRKGDYDEALGYFKKAKEVQDRVLDQDHSDKIATKNSIELATEAIVQRNIEKEDKDAIFLLTETPQGVAIDARIGGNVAISVD